MSSASVAIDSIKGWILEEAVLPSAMIRQGDLIRFERQEDALKQNGIVVTADCDLEQKKHARLLTLVPIVTAKTILERYLIPEDCERKRDIIERFILKAHNIDHSQDRSANLALLSAADAGADYGPDTPEFLAAAFSLDRIDSIPVGPYKQLMRAIKSGPKKIDALKDQIRKRGDLLVLPDAEIMGVKGGIAWVRHIWQTSISEIALRTSEVQFKAGERIARLDSPYRYRLTQMMGQVFADIGLPDSSNSIDEKIEEVYGNV